MPRITKEKIQAMSLDELKEWLTQIILGDGNGYSPDQIEALRRLIEKKLDREETVKALIKDLNL